LQHSFNQPVLKEPIVLTPLTSNQDVMRQRSSRGGTER
jgi:hypothetical protein